MHESSAHFENKLNPDPPSSASDSPQPPARPGSLAVARIVQAHRSVCSCEPNGNDLLTKSKPQAAEEASPSCGIRGPPRKASGRLKFRVVTPPMRGADVTLHSSATWVVLKLLRSSVAVENVSLSHSR
ncbi:unnamed protein product, partial [Pleuronectes platessa]